MTHNSHTNSSGTSIKHRTDIRPISWVSARIILYSKETCQCGSHIYGRRFEYRLWMGEFFCNL